MNSESLDSRTRFSALPPLFAHGLDRSGVQTDWLRDPTAHVIAIACQVPQLIFHDLFQSELPVQSNKPREFI